MTSISDYDWQRSPRQRRADNASNLYEPDGIANEPDDADLDDTDDFHNIIH